MIQISCEIMIDGWHDRLMIPSRLLTNMEFHSNLFKFYRTLHAWEPAVRIAIMHSEQQRQARAVDKQAGTYPSRCFPLCNMQSCHSPFLECKKILRVKAS